MFSITISRLNINQLNWWRDVWCNHNFNSWVDANEWLINEYNAVTAPAKGSGFKIIFSNESDLVLFKLVNF